MKFSQIISRQRGQVPKSKREEAADFREEIEDEIDDPVALAATFVHMKAIKQMAFQIGKPRASSILESCIRMHTIGTVKKVEKPEWSGPKSRVLFGYGNAYHYWVQNTPDVFQDKRVGWWQCRACGDVSYFGPPPTEKCIECNAYPTAFVYFEHALNLEGKEPVSGHPDLFLQTVRKLRITEIKSMNDDDYQKLKGPLAAHEAQTQTYMWGCSQDESLPMKIDSEMGYVLYINKKYKTSELPFKMYKVKKSPVLLQSIITRLRSYKNGIDNYPKGLAPPLGPCEASEFTNYKAKSCPCKQECIARAS
jgi:hypothetical protein